MFIITLLTIFAIGFIAWALIKLMEKIYNIIVLLHISRHLDATKQKGGIGYNKNGKDGERLEKTQSTITPF
jgi:hypothetical protein